MGRIWPPMRVLLRRFGEKRRTYTAEATVAFAVVERLMCLACSLTLDFASRCDDDDAAATAAEERWRTKAFACVGRSFEVAKDILADGKISKV